MDKTVLIEQTSKRLKRWELIVTAMLFLTLFAGFGLLYVAIPLGIAFFCLSGTQKSHNFLKMVFFDIV